MGHNPASSLSRRERQIMDIIYRRERATAAEVMDELPDPPSYSAVRSALRLLEEKGELTHEMEGPRYIYLPTVPREDASRKALGHLVRTFFDGRAEQVVNALVEDERLSRSDLDRLASIIEQRRREGK